jgi:hypothetical protein
MMCCASCGIAAVDDIKLKECDDGCGIVKYCSDDCQVNHREQHEEECKKRMTELRGKNLFTLPNESHWGECPICCLPLPIDPSKSKLMACCFKRICNGCCYANAKREIRAGLQQRCSFCREPLQKSKQEMDKYCMKRIKKHDPVAMTNMGATSYDEGDYENALKYWTRAAELGDAIAHFNLSCMYRDGRERFCVDKDKEKEVYHLEEAAMKGHPAARHNLGTVEAKNGSLHRARKHWIIGSNLGMHESLNALRQLYADGLASKEDFADALRAYQTAVNAAKSEDREIAEKAIKNGDMTYPGQS